VKFLKYLHEVFIIHCIERYVTKDLVSIFCNPTSKEVNDAQKESVTETIRFIIDFRDKKVFIFAGNLFHDQAYEELKKQHQLQHIQWCYDTDNVRGGGYYKNGKIQITESSMYEKIESGDRKTINDNMEKNKNWLIRYFHNLDYYSKLTLSLEK
jgi:hypothetical protein